MLEIDRRMDLDLSIATIMQSSLVTVKQDTPIKEIEPLFERRGIHHLLVEDADRQLLGVISSEDIARKASTAPLPEGHEARHLMTPYPIRVTINTPIRAALEIFLENRIRSLPVVNENGIAVGMVTPYDFLQWIQQTTDRSESVKTNN